MSESRSDNLHGLTIEEVTLLSRESNKAKSRAYCPYSKFQVGCAILSTAASPTDLASQESASTRVITGANIENAAYPVGTCAERVAFGTAIATYGVLDSPPSSSAPTIYSSSSSSGGKGGESQASRFRAVAVSSNSTDPCSPCGMCRQFLREFCALSMPVFMFTMADASSSASTSTAASTSASGAAIATTDAALFWSSAEGAEDARGVGVVDGKRYVVRTLGELLPMSFGPDNLIKHATETQHA